VPERLYLKRRIAKTENLHPSPFRHGFIRPLSSSCNRRVVFA
jgi:hypothetical protein